MGYGTIKHETVKLNGDTWDDIKDNLIIRNTNIENIYESIKYFEFFELTLEKDILDNVRISGMVKYYVDDSLILNYNINIDISYKNNKLNGEYKIMIKELDGHGKEEICLKYLYYDNNDKLIDMYFFDNELHVSFNSGNTMDKYGLFFYKEKFTEDIFNIYPEIRYDSKFSMKLKFINDLMDNLHEKNFTKGITIIYFTKNELLRSIMNKKIDDLYQIYKGKIIGLRESKKDILFCFVYDKTTKKYKVSLVEVNSRYKPIVELIIHDEENVETYAFNFKQNCFSYISFNESINNIHTIAEILGYKKLMLFDSAKKNINGKEIPISLVRKLAGKSFFYEKYGYHLEVNISEIEKRFNNFCERDLDKGLGSIRKYFEYIDNYRDQEICKTLSGILDHIFNMSNNKALHEMYHTINDNIFYKNL